MTLNEFKAWFDGFTEDMEGPPKAKQWARIQERVKEITGNPVSYPVYVDRYWNRPQPYWYLGGPAIGVGLSAAQNHTGLQGAAAQSIHKVQCGDDVTRAAQAKAGSFDIIQAMYAAGKADAADLH